MTWDYAQLSRLAKKYGGPEKLVEHIVSVSKRAGRNEMIPAVFGAFVIGGAIVKIIDYFKIKRDCTEIELEAAKTELIEGIKAYDASQAKDAAYVGAQDQTTEKITEN